jgi:nitric oxide reductase activation protein
VEAMRASLVFRQERPSYDIKLQKSGTMDDEELYRLATGDSRIFSTRVVEGRPDVLFGLLVDMSGSMAGDHLRIAQRLAQTFLWAVHDQEGVETRIWGHTGDLSDPGSDLFRLWEPGDSMSRLGLITTLDHGNNYDGFAIAYCISRMRNDPQPQKVLIVLSDGYPAGQKYGGISAQRHMLRVTQWGRKEGVETIQIAIDDTLRASDQSAMFGPGNWVAYKNEAALPKELTRLLARFTR